MLELSENADMAGDGSGVSNGPAPRSFLSIDNAGGGALIGLVSDFIVSTDPTGRKELSNWVIGLIWSFGAAAGVIAVGMGTGDGGDRSLNDKRFKAFSSSGFVYFAFFFLRIIIATTTINTKTTAIPPPTMPA